MGHSQMKSSKCCSCSCSSQFWCWDRRSQLVQGPVSCAGPALRALLSLCSGVVPALNFSCRGHLAVPQRGESGCWVVGPGCSRAYFYSWILFHHISVTRMCPWQVLGVSQHLLHTGGVLPALLHTALCPDCCDGWLCAFLCRWRRMRL